MSKLKDSVWDFIHECDVCENSDGLPTLYWKEKDFDLCFSCLDKLFFEYNAPGYKINEKVKVSRKTITEKLRNELLEKHNHKCLFCKSQEKLEIDHIVPFSLGGVTEIENLQVLCKKCNLKKRDKI